MPNDQEDVFPFLKIPAFKDSSFPVPRSPFPVPRSPFPVPILAFPVPAFKDSRKRHILQLY